MVAFKELKILPVLSQCQGCKLLCKTGTMNSFSEFLNFSREAKKLSGTRSSLLNDYTADNSFHTTGGQTTTENDSKYFFFHF